MPANPPRSTALTRRSGRVLGVAALFLALPVLLVALTMTPASADVIHLTAGGSYRGTIVEEDERSVLIETNVGRIRVLRYEISRIERDADDQQTFERQWRDLRSGNADEFYELGVWARDRNLEEESQRCFRRALQLDSFHRDTRRALGHRLHQGRWYDEQEYRRVVEGLVEYDGRWVTPEDRDLLEMGFVRDADGRWTRPGTDTESGPAGARPWREREPDRGGDDRPERPRRDREVRDPNPPAGGGEDEEDTSWYRDNQQVCAWTQAPVVESRYYRIRTNVKGEYAERYGEMMDRYYVRFLRVFREFLPNGNIPKSDIWVYSSQQEFMQTEGMGQSVGGFYNTGNKRVTAYHGMFGTGTTRTVLAHEGTHQFEDIVLRGSFRNCPIWILEGLAVFFESAYYDGEEVIIGLVPRDRLSNLKRGLQTNSLIPLSDLIRTPQPQFTGYHYAHAWGLIYMILYYSENRTVRNRTRQWFSDLFTASMNGPVTPQMVEDRCGGRDAFLDLEERWKDWIAELPYDYDPRDE
jgi:uncharacterized phage-associated protein